jgi:hypothetical protein
MSRKTTAASCLWVMAPLMLVAGSGCGTPAGSSDCVATEIEAAAVASEDETEMVVLTGRLTADGVPVEGASLEFLLFRADENGEVQDGTAVGEAETDTDGRAELAFRSAKDLPAFSTETVVSYRVEYAERADGTEHCLSNGEAAIDLPCAGFACTQ